MNSKFTLGRFINNNSWMHRVNPVTKLISWFLLVVSIFVIPSKQETINYVFVLLCVSFFIELVIISCKISFFKAFYNISPLIFLIIFSALLQLFFQTPSKRDLVLTRFSLYFSPLTISIMVIVIIFFLLTNAKVKYKLIYFLFILTVIFLFLHYFRIFPYKEKSYALTKANVYQSLFFFLRIINVVLLSSLLTFTTSTNQLNYGIKTVFLPLKYIKVPIEVFSMMITLALRFIPILFDEMHKIAKAQKARGVDYKESGFIQKLKTVQSLLIPIFVMSLKKADELAFSMEARSYVVNGKRSSLDNYQFRAADIIMLLGVVGIMAGAICLRVLSNKNIIQW